ncbi:hypothetical protein BaRGS_00039610 [Batillaria attramentaria]|uniref:Transmembrane protein 106B n=2 Tax=Batillaria attramentaria TaxID=370345 RepID=A0ABD0J2H6_9CAEN
MRPDRSTPVMNGGRRSSADGYEEFFKDSVPCPTCRGLGRVSKEQEGELVALIPMRDKRLKPRRTVLYVLIAVFLCLLTAGLCMFFLFPRDVIVSSNRPLLQPAYLDLNVSATFVNFTVVNYYNFSNSNFFPVKIMGTQMTSMYDEKVMATSSNQTSVEIPTKSTLNYGIFMNFILSAENDWGFLVKFCDDSRSWVHNLPITFELTANYTYLGHVEQATLTTYQQVSCYNSSADARS